AREAMEFARRIAALRPSSEESLDFLSVSQNSLASAYRASGELERSAETYRGALAIRERLVKEHPDNAGYRRLLLITYGHLGDALGPARANGLNRLPESVDAFNRAAEIAQWISARDPQDRKSWLDLAIAELRGASSLLEEPDGAAAAVAALRKAEPLLLRLTKDDPSNERDRLYLLVLDCQMGKALAAQGRDVEAARRVERALAAVKSFRGGPNEANAKTWGIGALLRLGRIRAKSGDPRALTLANTAAAELANGDLKTLGNRWTQASLYARLGSLYLRMEQTEPATLWLEKSAAVWREMTVPAALEAQRKAALAAAPLN
ncbi:MAG: tetratricopeptide repeat protein, partial [Bryobacteraceae bacterium]